MLPVGFEPTISAGERPQTYALDRAATGTGVNAKYPRTFRVRIYVSLLLTSTGSSRKYSELPEQL